ncbi:diacylglycerol kinase [Rossellomorea vietnamensis]|uniref:Diacylglycerol kinase family protein n=1 Tax=Rossellomorea vietnamensis TaxID=218284 RepID=A0ACD4C6V1_9BACI|nr:diacylglycerol kinase family protein [Rossellomorea vietnamensis]UXH44361.1 diacylglycerol kinase family protein [Rossellomorea vietnamensis]WQI95754.1 diacylglycerol kinase family protein [Rossellomorea vietnamensis]
MNMDSKETKFGLFRFLKSFGYAAEGMKSVWATEQNFRIHSFAGIVVFLLAYMLSVSAMEWIILIILVFSVLALETMNTAIEKAVDLTTEGYHPLAKAAKDLASASVLLFAICTAIVGTIIFLPKLLELIP